MVRTTPLTSGSQVSVTMTILISVFGFQLFGFRYSVFALTWAFTPFCGSSQAVLTENRKPKTNWPLPQRPSMRESPACRSGCPTGLTGREEKGVMLDAVIVSDLHLGAANSRHREFR